jgi:beta-N-acetylhexosaminidase
VGSAASLSSLSPAAVIFGCAGPTLGAREHDFFRDIDPLGFILFQRNCQTPAQVRQLVADLRDAVGRADAPVLIDQEGGRVARLKPPHWPAYPSATAIAALGGDRAVEAAWIGARLIADDLLALGITVDCLPVLDVPVSGADNVIGDRAYGQSPGPVTVLGRAAAEGLLAGGVLPVMKHMPGHGRALVDSHHALPRVEASRAVLETSDFSPFRALAHLPLAMTAHLVYEAIDSERPATLSARVIGDVIRASIGFDGLLLTDDLSMQALGGNFAERAQSALQAGCDVVLHCNGELGEMTEIASMVPSLTEKAQERVARAEAMRGTPQAIERAALEARFSALMGSEV